MMDRYDAIRREIKQSHSGESNTQGNPHSTPVSAPSHSARAFTVRACLTNSILTNVLCSSLSHQHTIPENDQTPRKCPRVKYMQARAKSVTCAEPQSPTNALRKFAWAPG